jgi:uncharacterized protein
MGWASKSIALSFNALNMLPNPLLGASLISLRKHSKALLAPPFPDVVVSMGRQTLPVAAWVKKQSEGRCKVIMLGRKAIADPKVLDLLVSCVHFRQLPRPDLFELAVPPTKVNVAELVALRQQTVDPFLQPAGLKVLVLVGGPTAQHDCDATAAKFMALQLQKAATSARGALTFLTSRRTPQDVIAALRAAAPEAQYHLWEKSAVANPYMSFLAHCDAIVVTGESESMVAEAVATQKPLTIYPLPEKPMSFKQRVAEWLYETAQRLGYISAVARYIFNHGWMVPVRDLKVLHEALRKRGLAVTFDGAIHTTHPSANNEFTELRARISDILAK